MKQRVFVFASIFFSIFIVSQGLAQSQWEQTNGPFGGSASFFTKLGTTLYAGSDALYRSTDDGLTWSESGFHGTSVVSLVSTGDFWFVSTSNGYYRSRDDGASWQQISVAGSGQLATSGSNIFVTGYGDVAVSSDKGVTWAPTTYDQSGNGDMIDGIAVVGSSIFVGSFIGGVFRSNNGGRSWGTVNAGMRTTGVDAVASNGATLYASTGYEIYRSTDLGSSWVHADTGIYSRIISLSAHGDTVIAGGLNNSYDGEVYLSTNGGSSWKSAGLTNSCIKTVGLAGTNLLAGTRGKGAFVSTNGGVVWSTIGFIHASVRSIAASGPNLVASDNLRGVYLSTNNGSTWTGGSGLTDTNIDAFGDTGAAVLASTEGGLLFRSTDHGASWVSFPGNGNQRVKAFVTLGADIFEAGDFGISKSTDGGTTWTRTNNGLTDHNIFALATDGASLYSGTNSGLFRSTDAGMSWSPSRVGIPINSTVVSIAANGADLFIAVGGAGLYRSTDKGTSWTQANTGIPTATTLSNYDVTSLICSGTYLYAGTANDGVYLSTDSATTWNPWHDGMTNSRVMSLIVGNGYLFANTDSSVWRRKISQLSAVGSNASEFVPISIYPNPLQLSTTVTVTLHGGLADVSIENLLGVEVAHLFEGELAQGEHSFTWNAQGMSAGTYVCVVRTHGGEEHIPIMLVK